MNENHDPANGQFSDGGGAGGASLKPDKPQDVHAAMDANSNVAHVHAELRPLHDYGKTPEEVLTSAHRDLMNSKDEYPVVRAQLPSGGKMSFSLQTTRSNTRGSAARAHSRFEILHVKPGDKYGKVRSRAFATGILHAELGKK